MNEKACMQQQGFTVKFSARRKLDTITAHELPLLKPCSRWRIIKWVSKFNSSEKDCPATATLNKYERSILNKQYNVYCFQYCSYYYFYIYDVLFLVSSSLNVFMNLCTETSFSFILEPIAKFSSRFMLKILTI